MLSQFTPLRGGSPEELVAAETEDAPIVALHPESATWWTSGVATSIELTGPRVVRGARWVVVGKQLRVGLGTLDLAAHRYVRDPMLDEFASSRLQDIAWFADGIHVALLLGPKPLLTDRPVPPGYDRDRRELVIAGGTGPVVRHTITIEGSPKIAVGGDRVIVAGTTSLLFDKAATPIAGPGNLPEHADTASFGHGLFVTVAVGRSVTLVDSRVVATWSLQGAMDAVAIPKGVAAVDSYGTVHVGCLVGNTIKQVAEASAGKFATRIQLVGDRLVVATSDVDPVRVATLTTPCQ